MLTKNRSGYDADDRIQVRPFCNGSNHHQSTRSHAMARDHRGLALHTGVAQLATEPPLETRENARQITLAAARDQNYSLRVVGVRETGVMPFSAIKKMNAPASRAEIEAAGRHFAALVNAQLSQSRNKDILIYNPGYNVDFGYSRLVSRQLQHFLGYQGAFVSFNWTATPSPLAYFRDQETALAIARRVFGRTRLGKTADPGNTMPALQTELARVKGLHVINVTDVEAASTGNVNRNFQLSPWSSSDLFLPLLTSADPAARGLVRISGEVA